jgi:hypothetical protein
MRSRVAILVAALAVAGCKTTLPADPTQDPKDAKGTRNEQEAEATVRLAMEYYANWNLEGAYNLICRSDRAKLSWADFKAGSEKNKDQLIRSARSSRIIQSGESMLPDGTPYVSVIVKVESDEVVPYSVVRESEGWRLIMVDLRRARQAVSR